MENDKDDHGAQGNSDGIIWNAICINIENPIKGSLKHHKRLVKTQTKGERPHVSNPMESMKNDTHTHIHNIAND